MHDDPDDYETEVGLIDLEKGSLPSGYNLVKFKDKYRQECSIQESSFGGESCIWLGVDSTGDELEGPTGKINEKVNARMHLTRKQVEEILPFLTCFSETGAFSI